MPKKAALHRLTFNGIPDELLARVLTFVRPTLKLLLVSKRWCKVALEECPAWWQAVSVWGDPCLNVRERQRGTYPGANEVLKEPDRRSQLAAKRSTLAGFARVARHFRQLHFTCDWDDVVPLIPQLLALAAVNSPHLESVLLSAPLADAQACKGALQRLSRMVTLRALKMRLVSQDPKPPPCSCLEPLSALTQLHSLDLNLEECAGSLPPSLLPRLQHLTHLGLRLQFRRVHLLARVSWGCGSPGAPRLRSLTLSSACLAPEEATLNSLGQLESLRLQGHCAVPVALRTLLHSLTGLTSLELHDDVWRNDFNGAEGLEADEESESDWCLGLLAGCSHLRRLELYYEALISRDIPPGSLQQLSYLSLDDPDMLELHMAASWACLPSLESLRLAGELLYSFKAPSRGLGGLKELDVGTLDFNWREQKQLHLPQLTRLVTNEISLKEALPPRRILRKLRHLSVEYFNYDNYEYEDTVQQLLKRLPGRLVEATSLEVLDLRGCRSLKLNKADAGVLRGLKSLRRLELNEYQGHEVVTFLRKQLSDLEVVEEQ